LIAGKMKVLLLAVVCVSAYVVSGQECGPCRPCETPRGCVAGTVKDACDCCDVCAKAQYELCDHPAVRRSETLGKCGRNLECRLRNDLLGDELEAICFCVSDEEVCGTDSISYENICALAAANARRGPNSPRVSIKSRGGPCRDVPVILSPPEHTKNKTGAEIALSCEAKGFPIPVIEWTWRRVDGRVVFLPSDDTHISVYMRGGPDKYQVTGWLQIIDAQKTHEGDYTCIAQNENGVVRSDIARVNVVAEGEAEMKRKIQARL